MSRVYNFFYPSQGKKSFMARLQSTIFCFLSKKFTRVLEYANFDIFFLSIVDFIFEKTYYFFWGRIGPISPPILLQKPSKQKYSTPISMANQRHNLLFLTR